MKKLSEQSSEVPETLASSDVLKEVILDKLDSLKSRIDDIDVSSTKAHNLMI